MKNNKCGALEKSFARKNELLVLTSYNITYAVDFPHNKILIPPIACQQRTSPDLQRLNSPRQHSGRPHLVTMNRNHQLLSLLLVCSHGVTSAFKATSPSAQRGLRSSRSFARKPINFSGASTSWCSRTHHLAAVPLEVIDPSYNLALGSLALGAVFITPGSPLKSTLSIFLGGIPLTLFGLFLAFQTTTLRFTFDDEYFSLVRSNGESSGENLVVGGENVWAYNKFVNYDLL